MEGKINLSKEDLLIANGTAEKVNQWTNYHGTIIYEYVHEYEQNGRIYRRRIYRNKDQVKKIIEEYKYRTGYFKIRLPYNVKVYHGRGKKVDEFEDSKIEYAIITYRRSSPESLYDGIQRVVQRMKVETLELKSSNSEIDFHLEEYKAISKEELNEKATDPRTIIMRRAMPIDYKFIENVDLNIPTVDGQCVEEFLLNTYKNKIPSLTIEKIKEITKLAEEEHEEDKKGMSIYNVQQFCDKYNISHYALDINQKLIHKKIGSSRNYPALIYYMISEHLYPVKCKKTRDSIIKKLSEKSDIAKTQLTDKSFDDSETIERFKLPYFENIEIAELDKYKDCNIFYHKLCLKDMLVKLFELKNTQYISGQTGTHITYIKYDNNVNLYSNANHRAKTGENNNDWKTSMAVCEKFGIPFKNQSIVGIAREVMEKFQIKGNKLFARKHISDAIKQQLFTEQKEKCKSCDEPLDKYEVDHILPISCGGDNDIKNLHSLLLLTIHEIKS